MRACASVHMFRDTGKSKLLHKDCVRTIGSCGLRAAFLRGALASRSRTNECTKNTQDVMYLYINVCVFDKRRDCFDKIACYSKQCYARNKTQDVRRARCDRNCTISAQKTCKIMKYCLCFNMFIVSRTDRIPSVASTTYKVYR